MYCKIQVEHCLNKNVVKFFKLNEHIYDHDIDVVAEKRIGLSKELKNVVEDIIVTKDIHTSKRMLIALTRMKRKGKIASIPNKTQLTDYLAHWKL